MARLDNAVPVGGRDNPKYPKGAYMRAMSARDNKCPQCHMMYNHVGHSSGCVRGESQARARDALARVPVGKFDEGLISSYYIDVIFHLAR